MSQDEVAAKAEAVIQLFDILLPIVPSSHSSPDPALHVSIEYEDQSGRFNIWIGNLGVLAKGHASLDYRLRDSPQLASLLKEVLDELQRLLFQGVSTLQFGLRYCATDKNLPQLCKMLGSQPPILSFWVTSTSSKKASVMWHILLSLTPVRGRAPQLTAR